MVETILATKDSGQVKAFCFYSFHVDAATENRSLFSSCLITREGLVSI